MFTLISLIISTIAPSIPLIFRLWERKWELRNELEIIKLKSELRKGELALEGDISSTIASFREGDSLRRHDATLSGGKFINGLRASVRPVITYMFWFFFLSVKGTILYYLAFVEGIDTLLIIDKLWDEPTSVIFAGVLGFWFGSRLNEKYYDSRFK